jgi:two-component system, NarL family, nitrate/nitrite response regulator NarL
MKQQCVRVLVADGHPVMRDGIAACLRGADRVEFVGEATEASELRLLLSCLRPDVVVLDLQLKGASGLEIVEQLVREFPRVAVLMFSAFADMEMVHLVTRIGARGYVLKGEPPSVMLNAIERVAAGDVFLSESLRARSARASAHKPYLSYRESQILGHLACGRSGHDISRAMSISTRTVETHQHNLRRKLRLRNRAALVKFAVENRYAPALTLREHHDATSSGACATADAV